MDKVKIQIIFVYFLREVNFEDFVIQELLVFRQNVGKRVDVAAVAGRFGLDTLRIVLFVGFSVDF